MNYTYEFQISSNDLKNLDHIEWFVLHSGEYEFKTEDMQRCINNLRRYISKKNIFYSILVRDYNTIVDHFYNDPYNYKFEVLSDEEDKTVESDHLYNYFVEVKDESGNVYRVPYQYIYSASHSVVDRKAAQNEWINLLTKSKNQVEDNFITVNKCLEDYLHSGVSACLQSYSYMGNGSQYHLISTGICLFIYNILLYFVLSTEHFFQVLLHFWQYFTYDTYSAATIFAGHYMLGLVAMMITLLFLCMDMIYIYGLYYSIYTKWKFKAIYKHYQKVMDYYDAFMADCRSLNQPLGQIIQRAGQRESVYIPLIRETSVRFDVMQKQPNGEITLHSAAVPIKAYYEFNIFLMTFLMFVFSVYVMFICCYNF